MVIVNPWILVYDVSFQLSFIATVGLIYVTPFVSSWFYWITSKGLKEIVSATIATTITVLPFVAYMMGIVSLVSIPANVLIAPLVPLSMLFGVLSVVLFWIFPLLSLPFVLLSSKILSLIISIAEKGSRAPISHIIVPKFNVAYVVVYYCLLLFFVLRFKQKEEFTSLKKHA